MNPTQGGARTAAPPPITELALAGLVLTGLVFAGFRFIRDGYLPQPFYFRVSESLLDLYSTAFWANSTGAFRQWHSVYPPLSFIFLRWTSLTACYRLGDLAGRDCDWLARSVLCGVFAVNAALVYASYRLSDRRTAAPRAIAMILGLPMLYALERGNLLIPTFTCFVLGYGDLIRRRWPRWLALATAINFKPYLVFIALPFIATRRWAWLAGCGLLGGAIYLVTALWYGSGWPLEIIANETRYAGAASMGYFSDIYYATAFWPLIRLLHAAPAGLQLVSSGVADAWASGLTIIVRAAQLGALSCLGLAAFRPWGVDVRRLAALTACVSLTAFTTGSAGYAQIFLFFLVFFEPWRGPTRITLLVATYALCLPLDVVVLPVIHGRAHSFLGGRDVMASFGVSVGQFIRPGLLLVIQCGLMILNFSDMRGPKPKTRAVASV